MAMVIAFLIGEESFATEDEMSEEEECFCLLNSWKKFAISCYGVMKREGDFENWSE
jgi:hypothetical protein